MYTMLNKQKLTEIFKKRLFEALNDQEKIVKSITSRYDKNTQPFQFSYIATNHSDLFSLTSRAKAAQKGNSPVLVKNNSNYYLYGFIQGEWTLSPIIISQNNLMKFEKNLKPNDETTFIDNSDFYYIIASQGLHNTIEQAKKPFDFFTQDGRDFTDAGKKFMSPAQQHRARTYFNNTPIKDSVLPRDTFFIEALFFEVCGNISAQLSTHQLDENSRNHIVTQLGETARTFTDKELLTLYYDQLLREVREDCKAMVSVPNGPIFGFKNNHVTYNEEAFLSLKNKPDFDENTVLSRLNNKDNEELLRSFVVEMGKVPPSPKKESLLTEICRRLIKNENGMQYTFNHMIVQHADLSYSSKDSEYFKYKENHDVLEAVNSWMLKSHQALSDAVAVLQKESRSEKERTIASLLASRLEAPFNSGRDEHISHISDMLKALEERDEETQKTNVQILEENKDGAGMQFLKVLGNLIFCTFLAPIGLPYVAYQMYQSYQEKGTANYLFTTEAQKFTHFVEKTIPLKEQKGMREELHQMRENKTAVNSPLVEESDDDDVSQRKHP